MNKNFEQMLRLVDYVDGLMVVDKNCIIRPLLHRLPRTGESAAGRTPEPQPL